MASLAAVLASCGTKTIACPTGFVVQGDFCVCPTGQHAENTALGPLCLADNPGAGDVVGDATKDAGGTQDTPALDNGGGDTDSNPPDDTGEIAQTDGGNVDTGPVDTGKTDLGPLDTGNSTLVGGACVDDLDCLSGLSCYSWFKGYCTGTNCDAGTVCPGASTCWQVDASTHLCIAQCNGDSDCRTADGYGCKRLTQTFDSIDANLCLPGGKATVGQACTKALDCSGSGTCLTDMPGGYCARVGCGASDACDAGSACVLRNGKPICLLSCTADSQCQIPSKDARKCVAKTDLTKKAVQVCLDSTKSSPVGSPCINDLDCDSKVCTLYAKGTCKSGGAACMGDADCGVNGPCVADPAAEKGTCSAPCATDKACPAGGTCIPGSADAFSGTCEPACKGPGDDASCGGVPGLLCLYGKPLPPPNGTATPTYACAAQPLGAAGAACATSSDCTNKDCYLNGPATAGYCTGSCGAGKPCPFGTLCVSSGVSQCLRMCSGDYDCPNQMACKAVAGSANKVCL